MAERLAHQLFAESGHLAEMSSAGTLRFEDFPADSNAVQALKQMGIDLESHRARPLSRRRIAESDSIVVMEEMHADAVGALDERSLDRVHRLWEYADEPGRIDEIADPVGGSLEQFVDCRDIMMECLRNWLRSGDWEPRD